MFIISETKEIIKYTVNKSFYNTLKLPDYCFPDKLSYKNKQFVIPYSKKEEFNLFLKNLKIDKELKETDNWRSEYKDKIDYIFDTQNKNMRSIQVCCNNCGGSNKTKCQCARAEFHKTISFWNFSCFIETGKAY